MLVHNFVSNNALDEIDEILFRRVFESLELINRHASFRVANEDGVRSRAESNAGEEEAGCDGQREDWIQRRNAQVPDVDCVGGNARCDVGRIRRPLNCADGLLRALDRGDRLVVATLVPESNRPIFGTGDENIRNRRMPLDAVDLASVASVAVKCLLVVAAAASVDQTFFCTDKIAEK